MINTLRGKLLLSFLIFSAISILVVISFNSAYFNRKAGINDVVNRLYTLQSEVLTNFNLIDNYINYDLNSSSYFLTGRSTYLEEHSEKSKILIAELAGLMNNSVINDLNVAKQIDHLRLEYVGHDILLNELVEKINKRGFKDYGLVGEMRNYVHKLEEFPEVDRADILSLRRHEKDYIIRNELQYVQKLNILGSQIKMDLGHLRFPTQAKKDSFATILDNYLRIFNQVVALDEEIGLKSTTLGSKVKLDKTEQSILSLMDSVIQSANQTKDKIFRELEVYYVLYFILVVVTSIVISLLVSRKITQPLKALTDLIQKLIKSDFTAETKLETKIAQHEVNVLYSEFLKMLDQLQRREEERNEAEKALRINELRYRQLADMLPQSVFETNEVGNLSYVNKTWLDTFGYNKNDIREGINLIEVIISDSKNTLIGGKEFDTNEFQALRKDGTTFPALVYSNPIYEEGAISGYRGIIIDHTERKKYIEALEKEKRKAEKSDRLKSAFLANMSHEIRTPMNAIIGFTSLMTKKDVDEDDKAEYIKHIQMSGDVLLNLIDDIIDIAKIEAGELKVKEQDCEINMLMDDLFKTFGQVLEQKEKHDIKLICEKKMEHQRFIIRSDLFRLRQILTNLIGNAVKFTDKGEIRFGYTIPDGKTIQFYVKDTGIGMSEENTRIIFDRFRQVEDSLNRKYGGTGLGLSISRHLVELMKGKIWVESTEGVGTRFYFTIPLMEVENRTLHHTHQEVDPENFRWTNKVVLIAEDDNNNFLFLRSTLKSTGISILRAKDGKQAVNEVKNNESIDLVLMDIQMPEMNGYEATENIKLLRPDLPVISQTAYAMAGEREKSFQAGCDDYISKPIDIDLLFSKMSRFLNVGVAQEG